MAKIQVQLLADTFIGGQLLPAGSITHVEADEIGGGLGDNTPNLVKAGKAATVEEVEIASIAPTGPNPNKPQSLPPGTTQHGEAYLTAGENGKPATQPVAEGSTDDGSVKRRK